jgi:quercetin dioxygenase-like cupin family protein
MIQRNIAWRSNSRGRRLLRAGWVSFFTGVLAGVFATAHGQRGAELGTVILDNEKVIVRRYFLLPGMPTGMHSHQYDYALVVLQGGTVKVTTPSGPSRTEQLETGSVAWRPKTRHDSENVGGSLIEALTIEVK